MHPFVSLAIAEGAFILTSHDLAEGQQRDTQFVLHGF